MLQGFTFFVVSLYWAVIPLHSFADAPLWVAIGPMLLLAAVEALFIAASVVAASLVTQRLRLSLVLTLPVAWTAFEWLRSWFPIGFPWNLLGYAAYRNLGLIQFAEITGVYGVSALIVFFNAVIYVVLTAPPSANRLKIRSLSALTGLMIIAIVVQRHQHDGNSEPNSRWLAQNRDGAGRHPAEHQMGSQFPWREFQGLRRSDFARRQGSSRPDCVA